MKKTTDHPASLDMSAETFRTAGHQLIDRLADFLEALPRKKVTTGESPSAIQRVLSHQSLPTEGQPLTDILEESMNLLFEHSLFNGHPKFWGYITSSAAPIGALADLIAASVNPNTGAFALSPMATEIERLTIGWLATLIGYTPDAGGLFVSGGNMANFLGFLTARRNKLPGDLRKEGLLQLAVAPNSDPTQKDRSEGFTATGQKQFTTYCARGTHTWIQKAVDLFGHGTDSIRWIDVTEAQQMDIPRLQEQIRKDRQQGHVPFLVIGNAGSVSTGAVDKLRELASICKAEDLWFHVDGAYGGPAAALPENKDIFAGITEADSIALDPHKWLYAPLEAGCILVRNSHHLHDTFSFTPEYYNFSGDGKDIPLNFHEYGMQNSRGFRALKVWLSLKQAGHNGITAMIRKDISLATALFELAEKTPELEAKTKSLSITTFRYKPAHIPAGDAAQYLNRLNETLLNRLQAGGEVFLSNAIIDEQYYLRVCIVNFRTTYSDIEELVSIVLREGKKIHAEMLSTPA